MGKGFDGMTVVIETATPEIVVETVTYNVKETAFERFARLFTRKDAPTATYDVTRHVPHFHTVEFDDTTDAESARDMLERLTDKGHEIVSVVVDENYTSTELIKGGNSAPNGAHVGQLLVAMQEDPYYVAGFVAAIHEYGFGFADDLNEWMSDNYRGEFDSPAEYAENVYDECYAHDASGMPDWVVTDWDASAEQLGYDFDYVTHPESYSTHVFWRHG